MIDERFIIRMADLNVGSPRCKLPRPKMKPTVLVTGWHEWLPVITVEAEV